MCCRWLGDKVGMLLIIVVGFLLMAIAYVCLGPAPPLEPLLGPMLGPWLIWTSLSLAGLGAGMAFVPLLPAMLQRLAEACPRACASETHHPLSAAALCSFT